MTLETQTTTDRTYATPEGSQGPLTWISGGGVTSAAGFTAAGIHCGLKRRSKDLALLVSDRPAAVAGVLTRNQVQAAPVHYCREVLAGGVAQAVVVNSGNANACTGDHGMDDTRAMAQTCADALDMDAAHVLVASTGVIGVRLPIDVIASGIPLAAAALSSEGGADAAAAIMTTDTVPKSAAVSFETAEGKVTVGGMTKGSGMIAPDMELPHATTLGFVTTDANVPAGVLAAILERTNRTTYNSITVDGDTSTNDTVCVLANGASGTELQGEDLATFELALEAVLLHLAKAIVYDGEGATRIIEVRVAGAQSGDDAEAVAKTVCNSPLVKTAFHSGEPNWGRFLMAVGRAPAHVVEGQVQIRLNGTQIVENGLGCTDDLEVVAEGMRRSEVLLEVDLGTGTGSARAFTCDLSQEYVHINASYIS